MLTFPAVILLITDDDDRTFMQQLYIEHRVTMFKIAYSLTKSQHDAEDIVSEACLLLIDKISVLRRLDCNVLKGYIVSTVKNTAFSLLRKKKNRRETGNYEEQLQFIADNGATPEEQMLRRCTLDELTSALLQLPELDKVIIRMKYFQHLTCKEIANQLGLQEVSVRSRLTRARQRIYFILKGHDENHEV